MPSDAGQWDELDKNNSGHCFRRNASCIFKGVNFPGCQGIQERGLYHEGI